MWPSSSSDWAQWTVPWLQVLLFGGLGFLLCGKKNYAPNKAGGETPSMKTIIAPPPPPPAPMLKGESEKKKSMADKPKEIPKAPPVVTKEKEKDGADDKEEKNELFNDAVVEKKNSDRKDGLNLSAEAEKPEEKKKSAVTAKSEVKKVSEVKKPESEVKPVSAKKPPKEEEKEDEKKDEGKKEEPKPNEKKPVVEKKDESGGGLEVDPTELLWTSESAQQTFKATNTTDKKLAYKVKTSNPQVFSVSPNLGFLTGHESVSVTVLRSEAPMKEGDTLMVAYCEATAEDKEPQEVFKKNADQHQFSTIKMFQK